MKSRYLLLLVGIVLGYEFAAAMTDFVVNVVFGRSFHGKDELARMFGRLGWIVSLTGSPRQGAVRDRAAHRHRVRGRVDPDLARRRLRRPDDWLWCAHRLGRAYERHVAAPPARE